MLRSFVLIGAMLATLSPRCDASGHATGCDTPPLVTQDQAICAAKHFLQSKSEACIGVSGSAFVATRNGLSWLVRTLPTNWENDKHCTGDVLVISSQTGQLESWRRITYQSPESRQLYNIERKPE